jgi:N-acetyl-alpha-D-muramate 1-phosphate uridylyltransferase
MASSQPVVAILAGGLATRLGALSASVPKSMIEVAGEPFIGHQLRGLARQDLCEVVVCSGHLGTMIEDFVGDGSAFGCRVRYSLDGERLLGTGGALHEALPLLGDSFMVMYGDSYLRAPLRPVWKHFVHSERSSLMTVFGNDNQLDRSNVEFRDGEIRRYDKITLTASMRHIDYGLGCVRSEVFSAFAPADRSFDLALFYAAMLERRQLAAYEVAERFYEIGSPAGLAETEALLRDHTEG